MEKKYYQFLIQLNQELIELRNKGIGALPVSNLEIEFPDMELEVIAERLKDDGLNAVVYEFSDGTELYVEI